MIDRKNLDMCNNQSRSAELKPAGKTIRGLAGNLARPIAGTEKALNRPDAPSTRFLLAFILIPSVIVLMCVGIPDTAQAQTHTHKHKHITKVKYTKAVHHKAPTNRNIKRPKASLRHASMGHVMHHNKTRQARLMTKRRHALASPPTGTYNIVAVDEHTALVDPWMPKALSEKTVPTEDTPTGAVTSRVLESAHNYLGTPYRYGGTTPDGFDCSGFVRHVFGENGIALSRSSREQIHEGKHVALDAIRPGDLIFFGKQRKQHCLIDHVGLYIGNGRFIHAASKHTGHVTISELGSGSYRNRVVMARRIIETP